MCARARARERGGGVQPLNYWKLSDVFFLTKRHKHKKVHSHTAAHARPHAYLDPGLHGFAVCVWIN